MEKLGKGSRAAYDLVRESVDFMENDVVFYPEMDKTFEMVKSGKLLDKVEEVVGKLN